MPSITQYALILSPPNHAIEHDQIRAARHIGMSLFQNLSRVALAAGLLAAANMTKDGESSVRRSKRSNRHSDEAKERTRAGMYYIT